MKKFGFATIAATGLAAAILGLASPAQAASIPAIGLPTDVGHHDWVDIIQPRAIVPQVNTNVQQSR